MNSKVEGTIVFDGLIEGRLPATGHVSQRLREWTGFAAKAGIRFTLDINASRFSLLPDNKPVPAAPMGDVPHKFIADLLQQLVQSLESGDHHQLFSTLRSSEYRQKEEVQAVYVVAGNAGITVETRSLQADTTTPPQPIATKEKAQMVATGLLAAAVALVILSFFVDLRGMASRFWYNLKPFDSQSIQLVHTDFDGILSVKIDAEQSRHNRLRLVVLRGPNYPTSDSSMDESLALAQGSVKRRLALEALARGYIQAELFNEKHEFIGTATLRIKELQVNPTFEVDLPLPRDRPVRSVEFVP